MDPANRHWRPSKRGSDAKPANRHRRAVIVGVVLLAALGIVLALLTYFRSPYPEPRLLSLALDEYPSTTPVPPWLRQDASALARLKWGNSVSAHTSQLRDLLLAELAQLRSAKANQPLVVFLAGYVVIRPEDDAPCLLPVDGQLDRPSTWVPLAEILDSIRNCPSTSKLLLLDVMRPLILPDSGLLRQDVTARIWPLLEAAVAADGNLSILTACSPGQISHTSEELGRSVFGYFLTRGLCGKALEGKEGRGTGNWVTVDVLADYVKEQVDQWAQHNLEVRQTPQRLGTANFPVMWKTQQEQDEGLSATYPDWLLAGWQLRDVWFSQRVHWQSPSLMREMDQTLLRAEMRWRAGHDEKRVASDLLSRLDRLRALRADKAPRRDDAPTSLAGILVKTPDVPLPADKDVADLRDLFAYREKLRDPKADEKELKKVQEDVAKLAKKHEGKPVALALLVFETLTSYAPGPNAVVLAVELLAAGKADTYDEVRLLERLAGKARATAKHDYWSGEGVKLALQTNGEAIRTRTAEARTRSWVAESNDRAAAGQTKGEKILFESAEPWAKAEKGLSDTHKEYQTVNYRLRIVQDALACRDEVSVWLPDYLEALEIQPSNAAAWEQAVQTFLELRKELSDVPPDGQPRERRINSLDGLTNSLRKDPKNLPALRRSLAPERLEAIVAQSGAARSADWKESRLLLATAWPSAAQRGELWAAYRRMTAARHAQARSPRASLPAWDERAGKAEREKLAGQDLERARWLTLALQMETTGDLSGLNSALEELRQRHEDARRWKKFAGLLASERAKARTAKTP